LEPKETPVRHVGYQALKPGEAEKKFSEAETVYAQCASSGNWIAARRKFAEVLEIDPRHDRANIFMAQVARQEGKNADSLRFVECALQANPNLVTAWKMLGLLHFVEYIASGKGNLDRALEAFAEASDRAEKNFDLYTARCCDVFRGMSFFLRDATGDREKAAQLLERVTILTRKSPFLRIMETLLGVMNKIYVDNDAGAAECEQLIESVQKALDDEFMSGDSFLERHDLRLLTEAVRHRVNISKIQATLV
jgi:tetratricopeptide (TPR) repeat protein